MFFCCVECCIDRMSVRMFTCVVSILSTSILLQCYLNVHLWWQCRPVLLEYYLLLCVDNFVRMLLGVVRMLSWQCSLTLLECCCIARMLLESCLDRMLLELFCVDRMLPGVDTAYTTKNNTRTKMIEKLNDVS